MLKVEFDTLHRNYPIFKIEKYDILCFLDTGANIPIWNGSIDLFLDTFKNCNPVKTGLHSQVGGFGIGTVNMPIYKISNFVLTDGKQTFIFKDLYIAVEENRKRNFDLLLTYSMFKSINMVIRPQKSNRKISFVTDSQMIFNTATRIEGKELKYIECYIQAIDEQDICANYINNLIRQENNT